MPDELLEKITKKDKTSAESLVYNHLISHPKKQIRQLIIKYVKTLDIQLIKN